MTLKQLTQQILENDKKAGWDQIILNSHPAVIHMLICTEVAEATEECRNGNEDLWYGDDGKPEGEQAELADALIRIVGYFGHKNWDLEKTLTDKLKYNAKRGFRHGGKRF